MTFGEGEVGGVGWFGEVCRLGRYVVWGGLQNAALSKCGVVLLNLTLASCLKVGLA